MEFNHMPVLLKECIEYLNIKPTGVYMDGTLGGAGHSTEILTRLTSEGTLIGLDQDAFALETASARLKAIHHPAKLIFENTNFRNLKEVYNQHSLKQMDGVLLDLGVSSHQLDEAERGFSYQKDAPLDMRMDRSQELTAEIVVNEYSEQQIKNIIRSYGEENWAARIATFIVNERAKKRIATTFELVEVIKAAVPKAARRDGPHPAKRTFQAIRIEVNNELGILKGTIEDGVDVLSSGGRLLIITFHSLEDRIVKETFRELERPCTCPGDFPICACGKLPKVKVMTRKPLIASESELEANSRSRSAKLRVLEKL